MNKSSIDRDVITFIFQIILEIPMSVHVEITEQEVHALFCDPGSDLYKADEVLKECFNVLEQQLQL